MQQLFALTADELEALMRAAVERAAATKPAEPEPAYVDARRVAQHFGVSRTLVHQWTHQHGCPHLTCGKVLRYELPAVEAWFRARSEPKLRIVK